MSTKDKKIVGWIMTVLGGVGFIKGVIAAIHYFTAKPIISPSGMEILQSPPTNMGLALWSLPVLIVGLFYVIRGKLN